MIHNLKNLLLKKIRRQPKGRVFYLSVHSADSGPNPLSIQVRDIRVAWLVGLRPTDFAPRSCWVIPRVAPRLGSYPLISLLHEKETKKPLILGGHRLEAKNDKTKASGYTLGEHETRWHLITA